MRCDNSFAALLALAGLVGLVGCQEQSQEPPAFSSQGKIIQGESAVTVPDSSRNQPPQTTTPPPRDGTPSFQIVGREAGLDFRRFDDMQGQRRVFETNGGGVALFDFDRDGAIDSFFTNGCRLPLKRQDHQSRSELFRNRTRFENPPVLDSGELARAGQGLEASVCRVADRGRRRRQRPVSLAFQSASESAQLIQYDYSYGCAVGDFDADGFDDLYVTAIGSNSFWHNNGDGTFSSITDSTGTAVHRWGASAAFADLNGDNFLDLFVVNYLDDSDENPKLCPHPDSPDGYVSCPPVQFDGVDDVLFLSDGQGGFLDATSTAGLSGLHGKGLGVVIADLDGDRRPEIFVANDGQPNFLFARTDDRQTAGGIEVDSTDKADSRSGIPLVKYENRAVESGVALNESGYAQAGMGVTAGDYDGNGKLDLFVTNFLNDTDTLYANHGGLSFEDVTRSSQVGPPTRRTLGWGTLLLDLDNDGWLDLFIANGHIENREWRGNGEPYRMPAQLFRNTREGVFEEIVDGAGEYFQSPWLARGVAAGDLDRDGRLDLAVAHQLDPSLILQNTTAGEGNSLVLQFVGTRSNRNGYGARVELIDEGVVLVRELNGGGSYQSACAPEFHIGLGDRTAANVRVLWPTGETHEYSQLPAGRWIVQEGSPEILSTEE